MSLSILMFCPQFRPLIGGAERQAEKLSIALAAQGCRVKVLTPRLDATSQLFEYIGDVEIERFPLFNIKNKFPRIRGVGLLNLAQMKYQIKNLMRKHADGFDIIHTHIASPLTSFAMEAAVDLGKPVLCKVAMAGAENDFSRIRAMGLGGNGIADQLQKGMTRWIATTAAVEETLLAQGIPAHKIVRIPNGVELGHNAPPSDPARFLYLGRISSDSQRDLPTVIKAFDRLAEKHATAELAVVGDGDLFETTQLLAQNAKHSSRIHILGEQAPDKWLNWANCYVQPSRREGLSNALLEAMSNGLACIANDIPPNREVLADGAFGFLTPIGDCENLYQIMHVLAADINERQRWGQLARERAENNYSIDAVAKRYIKLYNNMLSNIVAS